MNVPEIMKKRMCFSFEIFPPKVKQPLIPLLDTLEHLYQFKPDFISCTYGAGGSNAGRNIEVCKTIFDSGKSVPVPHLTCIGSTKGALSDKLKGYQAMGIDHILALRGDWPKGWEETRGDFNHANELVKFIKVNFPNFTVAVAGNPEKHFQAESIESDIAYLRLKQDEGADYIMTQLCHDVEYFERWVEKIRKAGIYLPIDVGVIPVISKDPIIRMTVGNGCSIPRDLAEIIGRYGDDTEDFKRAGQEYTVKQIHKFVNAGVDGLHIYSLNKWQDIKNILLKAGIRTLDK
ncbi:5,10-methylenetetrahydrofolate reductase [Acetobacterium paludosum]|uniref:Methylenetetrahydrofolate reductase n=1 Tax=Acetobacterium paludosum TaxID=52693 RepID=A0A923HTN3_9FIRM|nr:5,10-methylenetetrahydrofolate reductase [Acetobacterium paludosum]